MEKIFFAILIGFILIFIAYLIAFKNKIDLLHHYHYKNVCEQDIEVFSKMMGLALFLVGIGILTMPLLNFVLNNSLGDQVGLIIVILGIVLAMYVTIKYNFSIFGTKKK